jgi:hypothetical protein
MLALREACQGTEQRKVDEKNKKVSMELDDGGHNRKTELQTQEQHLHLQHFIESYLITSKIWRSPPIVEGMSG